MISKEQWPSGRTLDSIPKGTGFESWVFFKIVDKKV